MQSQLETQSNKQANDSQLTARMALNTAELESLRDRNERLGYKFNEVTLSALCFFNLLQSCLPSLYTLVFS